MSEPPRRGLRIWVARAEPAASRTAARLAALGHSPLVAPVLAIAATGTPPPAGPFDAVILTSANALPALAGIEARSLPVLAVGGRTAAAARAAGFTAVVEAGGDAAGLAVLAASRLPPRARLLHPAGADRKAEPAASLAAAGHRLETWIVYAAQPRAALPATVAAALEQGRLDTVLHYSRRSAATVLALAAAHAGALRALAHHCLSEDVAAPLRAAGLRPLVAPEPDEEALLAGLSARP